MRLPSVLLVFLSWFLLALGDRTQAQIDLSEPQVEDSEGRLRLDRLHDPESVFYLRIKLEPWANVLLGSPLHRLWVRTGSQDRLELVRRVDPRAAALGGLLLEPGVSQAAFSVWPPERAGGAPRPMWMMGFSTDSQGGARILVDRFAERAVLGSPIVEETGIQGYPVLTVGGAYVAAVSNTVVIASHRSLLQAFLKRQPDSDPNPDWPDADAEGFWRPATSVRPNSNHDTLLGSIRGLGIAEIHFSCDALSPGLELRLAASGIGPPLLPSASANLDFNLLREVPSDSDFLLLAGALPISATANRSLGKEWDGFGRNFSQPFALGVDVPNTTAETGAPARVGGIVRKPPAVISAWEDSIDPKSRSSKSGASSQRLWGTLEVEVEETGDYLRFSNAGRRTLGDTLKEAPLKPVMNRNRPGTFAIAFLSPELIARPYEDYFHEEGRSNGAESRLYHWWRQTRPLVSPLEVSIRVEPGFLFRVDLRSTSVLSPLLFLGALPGYAATGFYTSP